MYKIFAITDGDNGNMYESYNKSSFVSKKFIRVSKDGSIIVYIRWSGNEEQVMLLQKFLQNNCSRFGHEHVLDVEEKYCECEVNERLSGRVFKIDVLFKWEEIYENFKKNKKGEYLSKILYVGNIVKYMNA